MISKSRFSFYVLLISWLFLFSASFYEQKWNNAGSQAAINWDVFGYYFYLPSLFYDDLCELNNWQYVIETYGPSPYYDQAIQQPNGCFVMKYSCGMAVMYSPAFFLGHFWAKISGYPVDGFSFPYQFSISMWALVISLIGLFFIRKVLKNYFNDFTVGIALIILCFATNYFAYTSITGSLSHNYIFTLYSAIIFLTDKWHRKPSVIVAAIIGFLCGLSALARPTEILVILIPTLWRLDNFSAIKNRILFFSNHFSHVVVFAICFALMGLPQIIYWKILSGNWLYYSYQEQGFSFLSPHITNSLFSYRKGWLIYTPVMLLSLLGFITLYKSYRKIFFVSLIFFTIYSYITFSWDIWWYGGSFSHRAMIQSYAILLFPLSSFIEYCLKSSLKKYLLAIAIIFCSVLNIFQTWQSLAGIMESESMSKAYYWHIFGKTKVTLDDKRFIDTNEKLPENLSQHLSEVYSNNFENDNLGLDSIPAYSGVKSFELNHANQSLVLSPYKVSGKSGWFRAEAKILYWEKEWNFWNSTQFIIQLKNNNEVVKTKHIRIHRITNPGEWQEVYVDINANKLIFDEVQVSFWNANGKKTIYIDDIKLYQLKD